MEQYHFELLHKEINLTKSKLRIKNKFLKHRLFIDHLLFLILRFYGSIQRCF